MPRDLHPILFTSKTKTFLSFKESLDIWYTSKLVQMRRGIIPYVCEYILNFKREKGTFHLFLKLFLIFYIFLLIIFETNVIHSIWLWRYSKCNLFVFGAERLAMGCIVALIWGMGIQEMPTQMFIQIFEYSFFHKYSLYIDI